MKIIPAVDLLEGKCVQLIGGDLKRERLSLPDPVEIAMSWIEKGAERLHIIDLGRALGRGDNAGIARKIIARANVPVQIGGGIRDSRTLDTVIGWGAEAAICQTRALEDRDWLVRASQKHPGRIMVALDARGLDIVTRGWTENTGQNVIELAGEIAELPLAGLLYTNVDIEGSLTGLDPEPLEKLRESYHGDIYVAGGVAGLADIELAGSMGFAGVVVGTAAYTGDIDMDEVLGRKTEVRV